jgi:hypothetical protein
MRQTHPLAVVVRLVKSIVGVVLVGLGVVAEDLASVEEGAVHLEGLGQVVFDEVHGRLLDHLLLGFGVEDGVGAGGEEGFVEGGEGFVGADVEEEDEGLHAGKDVSVF